MSQELSVDGNNMFVEYLQNLTAHLGDKFTLAATNHYEEDEKADLSKEDYKTLMAEVRKYLFDDAAFPASFPDVKTAKDDIEMLKAFIQSHLESKDDMELIFDDILYESNEHWPAEGGKRRRRSKRKTIRKKRRATKKKSSRRHHK
jgi:hypothetical protein